MIPKSDPMKSGIQNQGLSCPEPGLSFSGPSMKLSEAPGVARPSRIASPTGDRPKLADAEFPKVERLSRSI